MKNVHQSPPQTVADLIEDKLDLSPEFHSNVAAAARHLCAILCNG
jgi:hypothetical protein